MFQIPDIEVIANGDLFTVPGRHGAATVSPTFGIRHSVQLASLDVMQDSYVSLEDTILAACKELEEKSRFLLEGTQIFKPGISIFWVTLDSRFRPTLRCFTMADVPDTIPLERIFDIMKIASFDGDTVYQEVGRIADVRMSLGLIAA